MSCDARSHRPAVRTDGRSCAGAARRAVCGYVGGCIVGRGNDDERQQRVLKEMQLPKILKLDESVKEAMIDGAKFLSRATIDLDHERE